MAEFTLKDIQGKGLLYPLEKGIPYRFTFPDILNSSFLTIEGDVSLEGEIQPILNIAGIGGNKGKEYGVVLPSGGNIFIFLPNVSSNVRIRGGGIQSFTLGNLYIEEFLVRVDNDGGVIESVECLESSIIDIGGENFNSASLVITPNAYKESKLFSIKPTDGSGDFNVGRPSSATRINSDGLIELVGNDVPRIHYPQLGQCPCILVEGQETNLYTYSEELDDGVWTKTRLNETGTPPWVNVGISPDGTQAAEKLIPNTDNNIHFLIRTQTNWSGKAVFSGYFKADGYSGVYVIIRGATGFANRVQIRIDLTNGNEFSAANEYGTFVGSNYQSEVTALSNGWYRIEIGCDVPISETDIRTQMIVMDGNNVSFAGNDTDGILAWGLQLSEDFSSYIPTTTAIATRLADVITVDPLPNTTEIVETFIDGNTNTITSIPTTYQLPNGEIKNVIMT